MDTIQGYLSRVAQSVWPRAIVLSRPGERGEEFVLRRPDAEDVGLGQNQGEANTALRALMRAEKKEAI